MVSSVTNNIENTAPSSMFGSTGTKSSDLQNMFTKLLVAQIQYQDPMNPMDNTEFTNQLAMFNQVSELQSVNTNLGKLNTNTAVMTQASYLNLLDRTVSAYGNTISVKDGGGIQDINFNFQSDVDNAVITIYDQSGSTVATINAGSFSAGDNTYTWDGKDEYGNDLNAGNYTLSIKGELKDGTSTDALMYVSGKVAAVTNKDGSTILELENGDEISTNDITKVES